MKKIYLFGVRGKGKFTLVDDDSYEYLNQWKWNLRNDGYVGRSTYYDKIRKTVLIHRIIFDLKRGDGKQVDHKNLNKLDNRKENLRLCTTSQNHYNIPETVKNTSGQKGVYWHSRDKIWYSQIQVNKKSIFLGRYDELNGAKEAYRQAALKYHGEFARV